MSSVTIRQMLEAGKLDMALTRPPRKPTDCAFEILRVERPVVVLNENHPLAAREHLTMLDLVGEPFVVPSKRLRPYAYDLVMAYFESVGAVPNVTIEATEKPAMMSAVAAGLGMGAIEQFGGFVFGAQFQQAIIVGLLLAVLMVRLLQQSRKRQAVI